MSLPTKLAVEVELGVPKNEHRRTSCVPARHVPRSPALLSSCPTILSQNPYSCRPQFPHCGARTNPNSLCMGSSDAHFLCPPLSFNPRNQLNPCSFLISEGPPKSTKSGRLGPKGLRVKSSYSLLSHISWHFWICIWVNGTQINSIPIRV